MAKTPNESRRSVIMGQDLWDRIFKATLQQSAMEGRQVSISEYLRDSARMRLDREGIPKPNGEGEGEGEDEN